MNKEDIVPPYKECISYNLKQWSINVQGRRVLGEEELIIKLLTKY